MKKQRRSEKETWRENHYFYPHKKKNNSNPAIKICLSLAIPKEGNDEPAIPIMHTVRQE
jgi:hypothetical protein